MTERFEHRPFQVLYRSRRPIQLHGEVKVLGPVGDVDEIVSGSIRSRWLDEDERGVRNLISQLSCMGRIITSDIDDFHNRLLCFQELAHTNHHLVYFLQSSLPNDRAWDKDACINK